MPMKKYQETVLTKPIPDFRHRGAVSPGQFGGLTAKALDQGAEDLTKHALKAQESSDNAAIMEALSEYRKESNIILNATGEEDGQEPGIYTRKGINAKGSYGDARQKLGSLADDLVNKAPDRTRGRLTKRLRSKIDADTMDASRYEAREWRKYLESAEEGDISSATQRALANYDNPQIVEEEILNIRDTFNKNISGKSTKLVKAAEAGVISALREQVIRRMILDDPESAMNYYIDHKDDLLGPAQDEVKKEIEAEALRVAGSTIADDMYDRVTSGQIDEVKALEELAKVKGLNGRVRDEATTRFESRMASKTMAETHAKTKQMKTIKGKLREIIPTGSGTVSLLTAEKMAEIDRWIAQAPAEEEPMLRQYIKRLIYDDIPTAATNKARDEFDAIPIEDKLSMSLQEFDDKYQFTMTDADYEHARAGLTKLLLGDPRAMTWTSQVNLFITEMKRDLPGGSKAKKDVQAAKLKRMLHDEYQLRYKAKGAPLSTQEKKDIISDFSREGMTSSWYTDKYPTPTAQQQGSLLYRMLGPDKMPYWEAALLYDEDPNSDAAQWQHQVTMMTINGNPTTKRWYDGFSASFSQAHNRPPNQIETFIEFERYKDWQERRRRRVEAKASAAAAGAQ